MAVNRVTRIDSSGERWYAKANDKVRIVTGLSDDEKSQLQRTQLEFNVRTNSLSQDVEEIGATFEIVSDEDKKVMQTSSLQEKVRKNKKLTQNESLGRKVTLDSREADIKKAKVGYAPDVTDDSAKNRKVGNAVFIRDDSGRRSTVNEEDEYSDIIVEGDKTYLETTHIINGKKTVTRMEMM